MTRTEVKRGLFGVAILALVVALSGLLVLTIWGAMEALQLTGMSDDAAGIAVIGLAMLIAAFVVGATS